MYLRTQVDGKTDKRKDIYDRTEKTTEKKTDGRIGGHTTDGQTDDRTDRRTDRRRTHTSRNVFNFLLFMDPK